MSNINPSKTEKFKQYVIQLAKNPGFKHYKWFVKYHLDIVEKIALELYDIYPDADKQTVLVLVWLHDFGKIAGGSNHEEESQINQTEGRKTLLDLGFEDQFVNKVLQYVEILNKKENLDVAPIEVKIVSSADGASHFVGPFYTLWWYEKPEKDIDALIQDNIAKANKDFNVKIVLPEVKKAFEPRYKYFLEQRGKFPDRFLEPIKPIL